MGVAVFDNARRSIHHNILAKAKWYDNTRPKQSAMLNVKKQTNGTKIRDTVPLIGRIRPVRAG